MHSEYGRLRDMRGFVQNQAMWDGVSEGARVVGSRYLKRDVRVVEGVTAAGVYDHATGTKHKTSNRMIKAPQWYM